MYDQLYQIWKRELQEIEPEKLPPGFYSQTADYLKRLKEESRMLDKRTVKARLLRSEMRNVKRMLHEVIRIRYRKLLRKMTAGDKIPTDSLTAEEYKLLTKFSPVVEVYQAFTASLLQGRLLELKDEQKTRNTVLRFTKDVPAIIGSDMKPYGPFKAEDVASLPSENAKLLVKQSLAERIEFN